jgi:glutamate synthase domain-containing protein 2
VSTWSTALIVVVVALVAVVVYDLVQRKHAILRNFPIIGHFRFLLEAFGPELRQYIVTGNDEERPFSRDQRRWVYTSAKRGNTHFGFGSDTNLEAARGYVLLKHAAFPHPPPEGGDPPDSPLPCAKVLGAAHGRRHAFRPPSIVNVSGMSFGALSAPAVEALNAGARLAGCMQNTGEGGLSEYHRQGGDLVFQVGTAYFGCRDPNGRFSLERLVEVVDANPVRAIEVKLSQGAKPGVGGFLPAAKVTAAIAAARGVPEGVDCASPPGHSEFHDVDGLIGFCERIAEATGRPVGIKSAVGHEGFWYELAARMAAHGAGPDFITIDGGEGGTGSGPLVFTDHVSLPYVMAQSRVYRAMAEHGLTDRVVFVGSGKLGFPESAMLAFALGCDTVSVGREAMLSIGCIQAQRCHTGRCPSGVATQSPWLQRGLDPALKSVRLANYVIALRRELVDLSRAMGFPHPAFVTLDDVELLDGPTRLRPAREVFDYPPGQGRASAADLERLRELMAGGRVS